MDNFMDKLAGKLGGGDVIKANSEAEARQLAAYKARVEELEKAVSDMRRLSFKCVETNEATGQLIQGAIEKIEEVQAGGKAADSEDIKAILADLKDSIDKSFKAAEEENHKENVRVYRNVQATVIEELKQQSEAIAIQHMHIERRIRGIKPTAIIALVFSGINLALWIAAAVYFILAMGL